MLSIDKAKPVLDSTLFHQTLNDGSDVGQNHDGLGLQTTGVLGAISGASTIGERRQSFNGRFCGVPVTLVGRSRIGKCSPDVQLSTSTKARLYCGTCIT